MNIKWLLLLLLPTSLFAQAHKKKVAEKMITVPQQTYVFHFLVMDDFLTTSPEKGGMVVYNYDTTGMSIDGEIEVNQPEKYITIAYSADKKHFLKAIIDGKINYDALTGSYSIKAHWEDTGERAEFTLTYTDVNKTVKVLFGPHKGDYADYWDRIYKFSVVKKE